MEFNIGDRVKVKAYEDIPSELKCKITDGNPHLWNSGKAKVCGLVGTVTDKMHSEAYGCDIYILTFENQKYPSRSSFDAESLIPIEDNVDSKEYRFEIEQADTIVVVRMLCGEEEIVRGHGHIIHEGNLGLAQATSYAFKKLYEKLGGF